MLNLSKTPWIVSGVLGILLLLCAYWAVDAREDLAVARGAVKVQKQTIKEMQDVLKELQAQQKQSTAVTIEQIGKRSNAKSNVQVIVQENKEKEKSDESPRPELSSSQLDRLRKLRDTVNSEAAAASELP